MAKLTAWLVTVVGVLLVLDVLEVIDIALGTNIWAWVIALAVLIIGIGKLVRNYKGK